MGIEPNGRPHSGFFIWLAIIVLLNVTLAASKAYQSSIATNISDDELVERSSYFKLELYQGSYDLPIEKTPRVVYGIIILLVLVASLCLGLRTRLGAILALAFWFLALILNAIWIWSARQIGQLTLPAFYEPNTTTVLLQLSLAVGFLFTFFLAVKIKSD